MDLAPDFDEFCGLLLAHEVEFVIGAYARIAAGQRTPDGAQRTADSARQTADGD